MTMIAHTKKCFNSTMVRLKEIYRPQGMTFIDCFNSTMVRLKDDETILMMHKTACFNSTMVRLKARTINKKILYKTRAISTRRKLSLGVKVVNVRLCKIHGGLTTARGCASNP